MKKFLMGLGVGLVAFSAVAIEWEPLGVEEMARWDASHRVVILESDLTDTNTATFAQSLTTGVLRASTVIEPVALVVVTPFNINAATTNAYNSTTLAVGDSNSTTQYIGAVQVNGNGTNATWRLALQANRRIISTADKLTFNFTGQTNQALSAFDRGRVEFYYREYRIGR